MCTLWIVNEMAKQIVSRAKLFLNRQEDIRIYDDCNLLWTEKSHYTYAQNNVDKDNV